MGFGKDLRNKFLKFSEISKDSTYSEEKLFAMLLCCFIELQSKSDSSYEIDMLHKNDGQVIFDNSDKGTLKKRKTGIITEAGKTSDILGVSVLPQINFQCEISDIAFIVYSEKGAKITYMQNKLEKKTNPISGKFYADIDQLALLKGRPKFRIVNKKSTVAKWAYNEILFDADIESVGSYGIFYRNGDSYDMCYYPADLLSYASTKLTRKMNNKRKRYEKKSKLLKYNEKNIAKGTPINGKYRYYNNSLFKDCLSAKNLEEFGDNLVDFHIGTYLDEEQVNTLLTFVHSKSSLYDKIRKTLGITDDNTWKDGLDSRLLDLHSSLDGARVYVFIKVK